MNLFSKNYLNYLNKFPGKRVLITGGGSGLGRSLACFFAKSKWNIFIVDIDKKRCEETIAILKTISSPLQIFEYRSFDLNDLLQSKDLVEYLFNSPEWNGVDIVINNAAIGCLGRIEELAPQDTAHFFNTNLISPLILLHHLIPYLKKQGHGHILNISSVLSFAQTPEMGHYSMAKAALTALSETLFMELKEHNVAVSVALPYYFKSNIANDMLFTDKDKQSHYQRYMDQLSISSDIVAQKILNKLSANRLYILPQHSGKILWYLKRLFPSFFLHLSLRNYRTNLKKIKYKKYQ